MAYSTTATDPPAWSTVPLWGTILEYVVDDPLTLLACMMVNKNLRKEAGKLMNQRDEQPMSIVNGGKCLNPLALAQKSSFLQFLSNPKSFCMAWKKGKRNKSNTAGPCRSKKIHEMRDLLAKTFVILNVQRPAYGEEESQIAILDGGGRLVAVYKISTRQDYQPSRKRPRGAEDPHPCHQPCIFKMVTSAALFGTNHSDGVGDLAALDSPNPWLFSMVTLNEYFPETNVADFADAEVAWPNYKLFRLFQGRLSPTEIAAVLMHAATSNPQAIYDYVDAVHTKLDANFLPEGMVVLSLVELLQDVLDDQDQVQQHMATYSNWGRELEAISYNL
ncbi:expressed unknown protein [Seminavis robusta]|uniref:Uncharacterized protein n=1 Tax=Seminavis robusta TaxID=568900 RepID=A0A9N8E5B7_9STRA|nr:expressed unknown protein [Seminavis robusta]|eukprot:Sro667_g184210.1 n/a (332) ;mRNA; f:38233-39228